MKELWCFNGNRISVRFEYEWRVVDNGELLIIQINGCELMVMSIGSLMMMA
jgi:nuclear transport factor 2 (NTF2) superfamily protein